MFVRRISYASFCFGGSLRKRLLFQHLFIGDNNRTAKMLDEDNHQHFHIIKLPRIALTHEYDGDMLSSMGGTGPDKT